MLLKQWSSPAVLDGCTSQLWTLWNSMWEGCVTACFFFFWDATKECVVVFRQKTLHVSAVDHTPACQFLSVSRCWSGAKRRHWTILLEETHSFVCRRSPPTNAGRQAHQSFILMGSSLHTWRSTTLVLGQVRRINGEKGERALGKRGHQPWVGSIWYEGCGGWEEIVSEGGESVWWRSLV